MVLPTQRGQPPVLVVLGQGADIWLVAKAGVGQHHPALAKVVPGLQVGTDAIALLPPDLGRNALTSVE